MKNTPNVCKWVNKLKFGIRTEWDIINLETKDEEILFDTEIN